VTLATVPPIPSLMRENAPAILPGIGDLALESGHDRLGLIERDSRATDGAESPVLTASEAVLRSSARIAPTAAHGMSARVSEVSAPIVIVRLRPTSLHQGAAVSRRSEKVCRCASWI